jgi:hypothetical protein
MVDKAKIKKKAHVKFFECLTIWDTSHPNVPTREMTKQSLLEDKEAYPREGALVAKKVTI